MRKAVSRSLLCFACVVALCGFFFIPSPSAAQEDGGIPAETESIPEASASPTPVPEPPLQPTPTETPQESPTDTEGEAPQPTGGPDKADGPDTGGETSGLSINSISGQQMGISPAAVQGGAFQPQAITFPARISDVFPDTAFAEIMARKLGKTNASSSVQQTELEAVTDLSVSYSANVASLQGISYLKNLRKLSLLNNGNLQSDPQELRTLTAMEELVVDTCPAFRLDGWIGDLTSLTSLGYRNSGATSLPQEMGNLTYLKSLDLSGNPLTNIPSALFGLGALESLTIDNAGLTELPAAVGRLTNLVHLSLQKNAVRALPAEIGSLKKLETFYLSENQLESLPPEYGELASLTKISLSNNSLSSLPANFFQPTGITTLDVSYNQLTTLPNGIEKLTSLSKALLNHNKLIRLPEGITSCGNLESLYAENNLLTELPQTIGQLDNLAFLYLQNNQLSTVPESIGNCRNLRVWNIDGNFLTALPTSVVNLPQCYEFSARNNNLTFLPNLGSLGYENLYLSGNHLRDIHSLSGGSSAFDANDQIIELYDYEKDLTFPRSYDTSGLGTILWDRGYRQNEVQPNSMFDGTSFRMNQNNESITLKGPSGKFSIQYKIILTNQLNVTHPDITIGMDEVYPLTPTADVLPQYKDCILSYEYSFPDRQDVVELYQQGDAIWIHPLREGTTFLTIHASLKNTGGIDTIVEGQILVPVQVNAGGEIIPTPPLEPVTFNTRGLVDGNIAVLGRPFMLETSDMHRMGAASSSFTTAQSDQPLWVWSSYHFDAEFGDPPHYYGTFTPKNTGVTTITYFNEAGQQCSIEITIVALDPGGSETVPIGGAGTTGTGIKEIKKSLHTGDDTFIPWIALPLSFAGIFLATGIKKRMGNRKVS